MTRRADISLAASIVAVVGFGVAVSLSDAATPVAGLADQYGSSVTAPIGGVIIGAPAPWNIDGTERICLIKTDEDALMCLNFDGTYRELPKKDTR